MAMPKKANKEQTRSFESRMQRLEEIVGEIEDGTKSLDDVVAMFEEGLQLSKECMEYLDKTELRLRKLVKDAGGKFTLTEGEEGD